MKQVEDFTASASGSSISFEWEEVNAVEGYEIASSQFLSGTKTSLIKTPETNYTLEMASSDNLYYFVRAYLGSENGPWSDYESASAERLEKPVLALDNSSYSKAVLSWEAVDGAAYYNIYRVDSSYESIDNDDLIASEITGLTFTDTDIQDNYYYYSIKAFRSNDESSYFSDKLRVSFGAVPVPQNLTVSNVSALNGLEISWTGSEDLTYTLYRGTISYSSFDVIADNLTAGIYTDTTADADKKYYYKVRANCGTRTSSQSSYVAGLIMATPEGLTLEESAVRTKVSWDFGFTGLDEITALIERSSDGVTYAEVGTTKASDEEYIDSTVEIATEYTYRLTYKEGTIQTSSVSGTITLAGKVGELSASLQDYKNKITLDWLAVPGADSYKIYCSTSESGTYTFIGSSTTNSFTHSSLSLATKKYYKVEAIKGGETLPQSDSTYGKTWGFAPSNISTSKNYSNDVIEVSWSSLPHADYYKVYVSVDSNSNWHEVVNNSNVNHWTYNYLNFQPNSGYHTYYFKVMGVWGTDMSAYKQSLVTNFLM